MDNSAHDDERRRRGRRFLSLEGDSIFVPPGGDLPPRPPQRPDVRIATAFVAATSCAVCGRDVPLLDIPIPTAYTLASIEAEDPPVPVCDQCIEQDYAAAVWDELRAERRRFERS